MTLDEAEELAISRDELLLAAEMARDESRTTQIAIELDEFICSRYGNEDSTYTSGDVVSAVAYILDQLLLPVVRKRLEMKQNNTQGEDKQYAN